jgi:hypothetical protein
MDWENVIFTTFVYAEAVQVKSLLEASGIDVFMHDENLTRMYPFTSAAVGGIKLAVPDEQVEKARDVLREYRESEGQEPDRGSARAINHDISEDEEGGE